jgi:hypothetical protein
MAAAIKDMDIFPVEAYRQAVSMQGKYAEENLTVLDKYLR